ncbi:WDR18 protein, partial [Mionectes macconnelli]|nr:WDR18 protein [Mionectes macconnelli]
HSVLQAEPSQIPDPRHVWSRHSLPITDLCCGFGGPLARAATASLDQTAKLWEISSGELLLSVLFDVGIMAVTLDLSEYHMFCGGMDGSIFQVDLCAWALLPHFPLGCPARGWSCSPAQGALLGRETVLAAASTGVTLTVSGLPNAPARGKPSLTCPRCPGPGPVTNAFIVLAPANMFNPDGKPSVPLPKFSKHLHGTESSDEPGAEGVTLRLGLHQQEPGQSYLEKAERMYSQMYLTREKNLVGDQEHLTIQVSELEEEVSNLRKINKDLFNFSARIITNPAK